MMDAVVEQIFPTLTWRIRKLAMYPDKEIIDMELPDDFDGIHFGLYYQHELTGVVSLFMQGNIAQFRKMAILPGAQGKGLGKQLLEYLIDYCKTQGINTLWCNARTIAIGFYTKIGFVVKGKPYLRNQIEYIRAEITV
ncbi:GNAT family N-acetyltransferase [Pedobacter sp. ASV28]|uniref:GNAT family N-acetyltransferase n=1 Tax=Pedobacter sp. ASV28 TaxID=2795123 RepID=UPI0018ED9D9C|nr:GNAT family N-acetyltransferase [Pedobacter sp. ASV28]